MGFFCVAAVAAAVREPVPRCLPTAEGGVGPLFLRIPCGSRRPSGRELRGSPGPQPGCPQSPGGPLRPPPHRVPEGCAVKRRYGGCARASRPLLQVRGERGVLSRQLCGPSAAPCQSKAPPWAALRSATHSWKVAPGEQGEGWEFIPTRELEVLSSVGIGIAASDSHRPEVNS